MMADQIRPPTKEDNIPDEQESQEDQVQVKEIGKARKLPRSALLALISRLLNSIQDFSSSSIGGITRLAGTKLTGTNTNENKMNYNKLKQKLFEAVSKEDMPCNKPRASTRPGKKKMVKACEGGKEKIVHFGAKGYGHNYSPKARKSFKARHKCGEKKSKLSAQYWACKNLWAGPKGSKASCPSNRQCKK